MSVEIEVVETESGYTPEEEATEAKKIPISPEFRQYIKGKKKTNH
jgi:hypothetical protein